MKLTSKLHINYPGNCTRFLLVMFALPGAVICSAQKEVKPPPPPLSVQQGKLQYTPDSLGNRIPDFSYCGYKSSAQPIPTDIPVKVVVPLIAGDATLRIQSALDYVGRLPMDGNGFRGVVLLQKGNYSIAGQLKLKASGVVLRGTGSGPGGTTLTGTGTSRETLLTISGTSAVTGSTTTTVTDRYVPVNALSISLKDVRGLAVGDGIFIRRPSTAEWINVLGTAVFGGGISALGWKPGDRELVYDRKIVKITGNILTIDAPITTALDTAYGIASITPYRWEDRIHNAGIENLRLVSVYNPQQVKDEDHRWNAIDIGNAQDVWVRQIQFESFAGSAVNVLETAKQVTIEDCISRHPVSEIGGQRRYTFLVTGQQTLVQRCYAESGYHDFATGYCAAGPNAFVQCESYRPYSFSGAIDSWSSGTLFDVVNVEGNALRLGNRWQDANGAGWAAANSVLWNCTAAKIDCYKPPTAQNWAFGCWSQFNGDGYWAESNNIINPRSLFYAQLAVRLNKKVDEQAQIAFNPGDASSSPSVETAHELTLLARQPYVQLDEFIRQANQRTPLPVSTNNALFIEIIGINKITTPSRVATLQLSNGKLVRGNSLVAGNRQSVPWWSGGIQGKDLVKARPAITRFVPGRNGQGLTDDLEEMTNTMVKNNIIAMEQNYGLWYDRRRDDHQRVRRMDGEVWPPFYELPFARTGIDTAWDGLSKYDLTKYNPFYWGRLQQFADKADEKGLVLIHQQYFQHNIIEAGAHYADFPWRTANNINNTPFPEPPPYAGDKRIFMSGQFYDISNAAYRNLHTRYIRQCLSNFKNNNGVLQMIGEEFTGPQHFVEFWLGVVKQWEKETGNNQLITLSVTKDVQDAILKNAAYAAAVDVIDIRYWHIQADGALYAPEGGQHLAPRQHARLLKPKKTSFEKVYEAVSTYRSRYPGKAVMYSGDNYPEFGWAVLMAGGSLPVLPVMDKRFLTAAAGMKPMAHSNGQPYSLTDGKRFIVYIQNQSAIQLPQKGKSYSIQWINPGTGNIIKEEKGMLDGPSALKPPAGSVVAFITP